MIKKLMKLNWYKKDRLNFKIRQFILASGLLMVCVKEEVVRYEKMVVSTKAIEKTIKQMVKED